jgi:hypothetical protein
LIARWHKNKKQAAKDAEKAVQQQHNAAELVKTAAANAKREEERVQWFKDKEAERLAAKAIEENNAESEQMLQEATAGTEPVAPAGNEPVAPEDVPLDLEAGPPPVDPEKSSALVLWTLESSARALPRSAGDVHSRERSTPIFTSTLIDTVRLYLSTGEYSDTAVLTYSPVRE